MQNGKQVGLLALLVPSSVPIHRGGDIISATFIKREIRKVENKALGKNFYYSFHACHVPFGAGEKTGGNDKTWS